MMPYILLRQRTQELWKNVSLHDCLCQGIVIIGKPPKSQSSSLLNIWDDIQQKRSQQSHYT